MAAEEARAVDDVGLALADELDELRIFLRRVLEIGVLNDHEVAGDGGEAAPQRRALAPFGWRSSVKPSSRCSSSRISPVPSVDPSSTTMSSMRSGTASTRRMISSIVVRSLNTGMTTEAADVGRTQQVGRTSENRTTRMNAPGHPRAELAGRCRDGAAGDRRRAARGCRTRTIAVAARAAGRAAVRAGRRRRRGR